MTGRGRNQGTKLETTIEQCRSEGRWKRVIELAEELKTGYPQECLANFLTGEGKLESYLEEHPPIEDNYSKAKLGLSEAKRYLNSVTGEHGKKAGFALDAHLLLAKLYFACGQYDESLQNFVSAELNTLSEKHLSARSIRILAESYAIKGMCLEKKGSKAPSKFKQAEQETEMITCFERAADLGILYLQGQDTSNQNEVRRMGAILETGLQRAPIVLIKAGKLQNAIDRYRVMLSAVETKATQTLRLTLARQLAEVLLRGVSGTIYTSPANNTPTRSASGGNKRLWEPRKYSGRQQFIPKNQHEETILLLLIAEALAVRDAVLSQSPEFRDARVHSLGNAAAIYDLLTLATVRWNQIALLHDSLEKALKFAFGEAHVWKQYATCLMALGRYKHAVCALKEHAKLEPTDSSVSCLMAARICYEHLDQVKEGLAFAEEALRKESKNPALGRRSRAQLYVGIGLQQMAVSSNLVSEKDRYNRLAFEALERAVQQDPNDHLVEYYLACQHALNYNITEALVHITTALSLRAEHSSSLLLFSLLLTANRRPKEALGVVQDAVEEFPDNLNLLHVKAHLELYLRDVETALETVQQMFAIWREVYEVQLANAANEHDHEKHSDTRSVIQMQSSQMSDKDSNSIHAASLAASRIEHALSEAASSLSSFSPRPGPQKAWMIQFKIWLLLADVYIAIEQPNEAINCIQEASLINPVSHQVMYMRGQIHIYQSQWPEAKQCFLNAVSANPYHTDALRALGEAHLTLGEPRLAEKTLKDAAKIDPNCPKIWFLLGRVMESIGDYTASADCMATALQLEPFCPVLPFNALGLVFD
ncbi:tetratricopeptide repeat protein 7B isoform X1 [Anopheles ziemanni]|uniref:tetratricopeptide repeat protein 7B isoform X1 n=1 Tax=Anopheles coustani TaxID=139045 RepID=UPI00265A5624|nr:tetratricopeptide repeat protein 7B isoform X1 [Anopheles coustani]XP_058171081.1 tetratricopeptide repeat protein 7B isoform X1 [Anopheles ziemanni]